LPAAPPFRELNSRYPVADLINAIGQGAATGHPQMPRFRFAIEEVLDLVAYVSSVQGPPSQDPAALLAGRRIAQRDCGGCHAVGEGPSPNPASPPFRDLHLRYSPGELRRALEGGMLAGAPRELEEGATPMHPLMPRVRLDADELAHLTAYLESLEPARGRVP
jgi:mono/diheme cytochrome c family protein